MDYFKSFTIHGTPESFSKKQAKEGAYFTSLRNHVTGICMQRRIKSFPSSGSERGVFNFGSLAMKGRGTVGNSFNDDRFTSSLKRGGVERFKSLDRKLGFHCPGRLASPASRKEKVSLLSLSLSVRSI
ncbi:hypothetical protein CEXT_631441 [Caerostris extrusa]|uniref:Uncharacterized protein n=1 Tax=Caerostris extrusa TaxID=172846 RepID=A0AAV4Y1X6_CAEEX|nr:hypothetical protein CEXT_631441 [Caerostris extrusa]